jgi:MFS family permease
VYSTHEALAAAASGLHRLRQDRTGQIIHFILNIAAKGPRFRGWYIVAMMSGPRAAGTGTYILGSTLFVIPLETYLGLSRSMSALLFASGSMVAGLAALISGALMDRYGPRWVLLASVIISALGYILFAMTSNVLMVYIVFVGVISPVILNVAYNAGAAFINNWFSRYRATAMSFLQVGAGIGAIIIIPTLAFIIDNWQWRAAAIAAAGFILALGLPAALLSRDTPEEVGMLPDGESVSDDRPTVTTIEPTAKEAFRTRGFWSMVGAVMAFGGATAALQIHFLPIMVWKGMDEVQGALVLTVMAIMSTPAVLVMGPLADRFGRMTVAGGTATLVALGVVLLNLSSPVWSIWGAALIIAPNFGMYPLIWAALGHAFGRKSFSTIRGTVLALQVGGTLGMPILAGMVFDRTESYSVMLWVIAGLWITAAILLFLAPSHSYVRTTRAD